MKAKLLYGFEIGVSENWKVQEAPEEVGGTRPILTNSWFDDSETRPDFRLAAWARLYDAVPWTSGPDAPPAQQESVAKSYFGINFEDIGHDIDVSLVITVIDTRFEVDGLGVLPINVGALQSKPITGRYSEKLRRALIVLGLTPVQQSAQWLLTGLDT